REVTDFEHEVSDIEREITSIWRPTPGSALMCCDSSSGSVESALMFKPETPQSGGCAYAGRAQSQMPGSLMQQLDAT
ncbi:MAG TPA: hypothetical protein DIT64_21475, partial [Verrucomicrobiales bacterium]|nr:hypothetical protein [Verrucomicrobiales bacterium]